MASYTEWDRLVNLFRASSKSPNIAKAFDEAKKHSIRQDNELTALAALIGPPAPVPPPPGGALGVDRATMLATGGTILREDNSAVADPKAGLWGTIEAIPGGDARHVHKTTGGDSRPKADGVAQGNTSYRELTLAASEERTELGRNERRYGENTGAATNGTFALFSEGEHKIIFWSQRFGAGFDSSTGYQVSMQAKQAQPYAANGPTNSAPAITIDIQYGEVILENHWVIKWTTTPPPNNVWIRFALDVVWSKDPALGRIKMYIDNDNDGDFLDADEYSGSITCATLAYASTAGSGLSVNDPIPGHLRLGMYHNSTLPACVVDIDNVQIVG